MNSTYSKKIKGNNIILKLLIIICILIYLAVMFSVIYKINTIHHKEIKEKERIYLFKSSQENNVNDIKEYNNKDIIDKNIILTPDINNDISKHEYNNSNHGLVSKDTVKSKKTGDCIIEIPDIDLAKIVYTGKDREKHLQNYELITATDDMKYSQGGNYIICGHASRLYGHSLNRIKEIKKGTEILITDNNKTDKYIVNKVYYSNMMDTDNYCRQNNKKEITIISCAKYISKESYIIINALPK